jgi:hypothetical protein
MSQYSPGHVAAFQVWQKNGSLGIDEATVVAIEREDPATGAEIRETRERRAQHQRDKAATPQQPVAPSLRLAVPHKGEDWDQFAKRCAGAAVPLVVFDAIREVVFELLRKGADERRALEERLAALEQKPSVKYRGVWAPGTMYAAGDAVTQQGSLWIARTNHLQSEPGVDFVGWTLAVKRGRDARAPR